LPNILKNRDRVIFLDTDMIVLSDIGYLFNVNLEGKVIGAVKDLIMKTFSSMGVKSLTEKHITTYVYLSDFLGLKSRVSEYFQAGTLVFDLKQMRQQLIAEKILKDLKEKQFWFLDQDALNKNLVGKVKFLDYGWNTVTIDEEHRANLTKMDNALYFQSQKSPKIIHYAGLDKPWSNFNNPFAYYYWFYLRLTPWYEEVFLNYLNKNAKKILKRKKKNFLFRIRKFLKLKKTS
jgi:lipopolysaccharide biosynthesis glycosyltransferase